MEKKIKENLEKILEMDAPDKVKAQLQNLGLSEKEINNQTAVAVALYQQAIKGNVNAINTIDRMTAEEVQIHNDETNRKRRRGRAINSEIERISKLFESMLPEQKELARPLIENAGFMSYTLNELRNEIAEQGIKEQYRNGMNQSGYRNSVEVKTYNSMMRTYMIVIKQLSDMLPNANGNDLQDEFDRFCDEE